MRRAFVQTNSSRSAHTGDTTDIFGGDGSNLQGSAEEVVIVIDARPVARGFDIFGPAAMAEVERKVQLDQIAKRPHRMGGKRRDGKKGGR
jgi:hypothetical protein